MYDRLLSWAQLAPLVPFSREHIRRLELLGEFPMRRRVGRLRVAWLGSEIDAWIKAREFWRAALPPRRPAPSTVAAGGLEAEMRSTRPGEGRRLR